MISIFIYKRVVYAICAYTSFPFSQYIWDDLYLICIHVSYKVDLRGERR